MFESNTYVIVKIDSNIKDENVNNANVKFIYDEDDFIQNIMLLTDDELSQLLVYKNGVQLSPYDCKMEIEIYNIKNRLMSKVSGGDI